MLLFCALYQDLKRILRHFSSNDISVYAAQASFFILLAVFPFLMFLLTLLQYIPQLNEETVIRVLELLLPERLHALAEMSVRGLYIESPGTAAVLTALSALWSAGKGILSIEKGLNRIYGYTDPRNYLLRRILCAGYTFVFAACCTAALMLLVLGASIRQLVTARLPVIAQLTRQILDLGGLLTFLLLFAAFLLLYTFLPWRRQNPRHQVPGAVFAATGWMIFSVLFSLYFQYFDHYSRMYGSLTAVVLAMLWLYACICLLFLGAELNRSIREWG